MNRFTWVAAQSDQLRLIDFTVIGAELVGGRENVDLRSRSQGLEVGDEVVDFPVAQVRRLAVGVAAAAFVLESIA